MTFKKLPAVPGSFACITCGAGARSDLDMKRPIAVGFGNAGYSKDGKTLWQESPREDLENVPTVADVETLAQQEPHADWRIFFFAPLYESEYQRQDNGIWILVKSGMGFA